MATKIVSQLDSLGYFVQPTVADESPLEPGVFLIPAGAVDVPVPTIPEGSRAKWNGTSFDMEVIPVPPPPAPEEPVPLSCTPWQMRKALTQLGLRAAVESYLATASLEAKDGWEVAAYFEETDPFVQEAKVALGMTDADVTNLFTLARSL